MRGWLATWDPNMWSLDKLQEAIKCTSEGKIYKGKCTCFNSNIKVGDIIFFIEIGESLGGLIAFGYATSEICEMKYPKEDKNTEGKAESYIDVKFKKVLDLKTEEVISQKKLEQEFSEQMWNPMESVIEIKPEIIDEVLKQWNNKYKLQKIYEKKFSVYDSVWIAAALMSIEVYTNNCNAKKDSYYFKQADIVKCAQIYADGEVQSARVSSWTCADSKKKTYNYLRGDDIKDISLRRLSAPNEMNGEKTMPIDLDEEDKTPIFIRGEQSFSLNDLFHFVKEQYPSCLVQEEEEEVDCLEILSFLESNEGRAYTKPDKADLKDKEKFEKLKEEASIATKRFKVMSNRCCKRFELVTHGANQWLDGSNTKVRSYLWIQMKDKKYKESPESVSLFAEMCRETGEARFRISLEIKDADASTEDVRRHNRLLDVPLNENSNLVYIVGGNNFKEGIGIVNENANEVKKKLVDGTYTKVQVSRVIEKTSELTNKEIMNRVTDAVCEIKKIYDYVFDEKKEVKEDEFYPSLGEYDPEFDAVTYEKLLSDVKIVKRMWLDVLYYLYKMGGIGTCKEIALKYGNGSSHYNRNGINIAKALQRETGCPVFKRPDGSNAYWPILFYGKDVEEANDEGIFSYKLREALFDAIQSMEKKGVFDVMDKKENFNDNMILYGPPGTGKTYNTAIYAVAICDGKQISELEDYNTVMKRYNELKKEGRVAFTTFHQSYGYEEFIEGIKPIMDGESENVSYTIASGVFKRFCEKAGKPEIESTEFKLNPDAHIWKITIQDGEMNEIKKECFRDQKVRIGFSRNEPESKAFVENIEKGDIIISLKKRTSIDAIGIVTSDEAYELKNVDTYALCHDVNWLVTEIDVDICKINGGKQLNRLTVCRVPSMKVEDIIEVVRSNDSKLTTDIEVTSNDKPYIFIIDEINRGNISKIFGELITLIETTKRKGKDEEMQAILPYSGEMFSVPQNIYILGTMNTADRSIALMDTALRRRFQFVEMMPNSKVLKDIGANKVKEKGEEIDVIAMLDKINERIEFLYDREHTIGHAFFTGLKNDASINKLADIFKKSVIPLLQEYFYEDYSKIQMILGDNDKNIPDNCKFILNSEIKTQEVFSGNVSDIDLPEYKFDIKYDNFINPNTYIKIYSKL